jgi:hypothetical protein
MEIRNQFVEHPVLCLYMSVRITSFKQAQGQDVLLLLLIVTEATNINSSTLNADQFY